MPVSIRVPDEAYFKLVELKGKLKCKNWTEFATKLIYIFEHYKFIEISNDGLVLLSELKKKLKCRTWDDFARAVYKILKKYEIRS